MQISQLKSRNIRAALSVILGILLGAFYLTANLIFCMLYEDVWYLSLALYQLSLLVCRYYALFLNELPHLKAKIGFLLTLASAFMSLSLFYSVFSPLGRLRSTAAAAISLIYFSFLFLRFLLSLRINRGGDGIFSLVFRLRILSLLSALYAFLLQLSPMLNFGTEREALFSFLSAFLCSYFMLISAARE